ncbi:MAG: 1-acyl-sn-glycerol-3-phosphate acyltransferase [Chloroflexota bacterium]
MPRYVLTPGQRISRAFLRAYARWRVARECRVTVIGRETLPRSGPLLVAARHYHHLYDAGVLLAHLPRSPHFLVALDWAHSRRQRWLLEHACQLAAWPGLLRADRVPNDDPPAVWRTSEIAEYQRRAMSASVAILTAGRTLVVFPEGSPVIDPEQPERSADSLLPFQRGFVSLARQAARELGRPVPVVPAGFAYVRAGDRWDVRLAFGSPLLVDARDDRLACTKSIEEAVRRLSGL